MNMKSDGERKKGRSFTENDEGKKWWDIAGALGGTRLKRLSESPRDDRVKLMTDPPEA